MIGPRLAWFAGGVGAGVYAMVKGRRAAEALTADGLKDRAGSLALGARMFAEEVDAARAEKETQLRTNWGLMPHGRHARGLAPAGPRSTENSTTSIQGSRPSSTDQRDEEGTT